MAIAYRIYGNHGAGGPVDDSAPIGTTTGLSFVIGPLNPSTDNTFVVRAYDPATGLEESNTETSVRVVIDPAGRDVSGLPNPPHAVALSDAANGGCRVTWAYAPASNSGRPQGFHVYMSAGSVADASAPLATVPYVPGVVGYSCLLPGSYTRTTYTAIVRAFNAGGTESNENFVTKAVGLSPVPYMMEPAAVVPLSV